jgi:DNA-binding LacI/PurR family transcriptional regulator
VAKKASIATVARVAKTSTGTVSRVLNGGYVADRTRERVLSAIRRLEYVPRSVSNRQRRVCAFLPWSSRPLLGSYMGGVIHGLSEVLSGETTQLLLLSLEGSDRKASARILQNVRADVLVSLGSFPTAILDVAAKTSALVQVGSWDAARAPVVYLSYDSGVAAVMATRHLLAKGHRRVALLSERDGRPGLTQFRKTFEKEVRSRGGSQIVLEAADQGEAFQKTAQSVGLPDRPTALLVYGTSNVLPAMQAVHFSGKRIPEDISVIGYEDRGVSEFLNPPLTTIGFDPQLLGRKAGEAALALLAGKKGVANQRLKPRLLERSSVRRI